MWESNETIVFVSAWETFKSQDETTIYVPCGVVSIGVEPIFSSTFFAVTSTCTENFFGFSKYSDANESSPINLLFYIRY